LFFLHFGCVCRFFFIVMSFTTPSGIAASCSDYITYLEQLPKWQHPDVPFTIQGASLAGCATGFIVPEWRFCFDAGYPSRMTPAGMVLTHTHTDHTRALLAQVMNRAHTFNIFCPTAAVEPLQHYFTACTNMRACSTRIRWNSNLYKGKLVPLAEGGCYKPVAKYYKDLDTPPINTSTATRRRRKVVPLLLPDQHPHLPNVVHHLYVRATQALQHTIPSQGYIVAQRRHRLPAPLMALDTQALRALPLDAKREYFLRPLLAFVCDGDTSSTVAALDALHADPEGLPYVVMVECTFIDDGEAQEATHRRHVLYSGLLPALQRLVAHQREGMPCHVLLIHLSRRYDQYWLTHFKAKLPPYVHLFS
jgi:hypothetical protein